MKVQPNDKGILEFLHRYVSAPRLQCCLLLQGVPSRPDKVPTQALHLISTKTAEPPEQLWKVTKPHNTKFLGCGCWLGPSKPASPYRACFIAILQNSRGVREMQTVMLESSSPQSICRKAFPACCLYPASRICGEGRAILVPKGVRRERQSQAIAPDLQTLWKSQLTVVPGTPWDLPREP